MTNAGRSCAFVAGGCVVVLVLLVLRFSPIGPGPGLPSGATPLNIVTAAPHLIPSMGCPAALLAPARVATAGDDLVMITVETGEPVRVVWPSGWAAWRIDGRAELVGRHGEIVAREGDVLDSLGGGMVSDDAFGVCFPGS